MPIFKINGELVLFAHIPKTGGATVQSYFRNYTSVHMFDDRPLNPDFRCSPQHFHCEQLKTLLPFDWYGYKFTIIRNPYTRLVSEYRMRMRDKIVNNVAVEPFDRWVNRTFNDYAQNPYTCDNHIRPQWQFVDNSFEIFRFEERVPIIINKLQQRLQLPPIAEPIPHRQKSQIIPVSPSKATLSSIADFYKEDFRRFNYALSTCITFIYSTFFKSHAILASGLSAVTIDL
jgi:Sulfotransferase family